MKIKCELKYIYSLVIHCMFKQKLQNSWEIYTLNIISLCTVALEVAPRDNVRCLMPTWWCPMSTCRYPVSTCRYAMSRCRCLILNCNSGKSIRRSLLAQYKLSVAISDVKRIIRKVTLKYHITRVQDIKYCRKCIAYFWWCLMKYTERFNWNLGNAWPYLLWNGE